MDVAPSRRRNQLDKTFITKGRQNQTTASDETINGSRKYETNM